MRPNFRLIVQISSHVCTVRAYKFTSACRIDFVIINDSHDLLEKTGVKLAIFHYEASDKNYLHPEVSYRQMSPLFSMPNFSFEHAIKESIKRHEGVFEYNLQPAKAENTILL